jgi:glycosyltransferase involved in cell wall biosynthesis
MPRLCLNMIVKNEAARITRALDSVTPFIDSYVIVDTGSTDGTEEVIKNYFLDHKIAGFIGKSAFNDWSQARNAALRAARMKQTKFGWDWALLMDADMELVMLSQPDFVAGLDRAAAAGVLSVDIEQRAGQLHYQNRRLISKDATGWYRGVTHEYLDVAGGASVANDVAYFKDHADGANRPEKFKRDIALLEKGLADEPNNERYMFYLAQSYRDGGELDKAMEMYKKRVDAGGWAEEQWNAQVNYAHCFKEKGDEPQFVINMLKAYNMRPSRAEAMYDLAHYFREKDGNQNIAALFAEVGLTIPRTNDGLFVSDYAYNGGIANEFAITGFYNEAKKAKAFKVCSDLSLKPTEYPWVQSTARHNLYYYMPLLPDLAPSFKSEKIDFTPPDGWRALNPSVTNYGAENKLACAVRTVNYRIDEHGAYWVGDQPLGDTPIKTRTFMLDLGKDPFTAAVTPQEIILPSDLPMAWPLVQGFEDVRLFTISDEFWGSATCRQLHWDGNCEQVMFRINEHMDVDNVIRMLREPRNTQKNWAPIVGYTGTPSAQKFMFRPGHVVDVTGADVIVPTLPIATDTISGGSQVVPFGPGYISLVHTAHVKPGSTKRYYYHRWTLYDKDMRLIMMSLPFAIHDKQIEFVAGLAWHPNLTQTMVFSYGVDDCEARIATISENDIMRMLWQTSKS